MKRFFLILPGKNYLLHKNIVQFFFSQICFPEGTKLTPNQVEKLRKFEGEVVVGGGVYDKHPLELGGYSKSALHGGYGYFLELHKVVYLGIYSVFL